MDCWGMVPILVGLVEHQQGRGDLEMRWMLQAPVWLVGLMWLVEVLVWPEVQRSLIPFWVICREGRARRLRPAGLRQVLLARRMGFLAPLGWVGLQWAAAETALRQQRVHLQPPPLQARGSKPRRWRGVWPGSGASTSPRSAVPAPTGAS